MNGRAVTATLLVAVIIAALVPMAAEDSEGETEYGPMELRFYNKEGGRVILTIGMEGPDFIVPFDIPLVSGSYGWSIYGVEYPGRSLAGTSLKVYASTHATYANPVVLEAYPIFDDPASASGEESGDLGKEVFIGLAIAGVAALIVIGVMLLGAGGRRRGDSDPYGRYEPYSPWYKRP